jgi:hypothetical protein
LRIHLDQIRPHGLGYLNKTIASRPSDWPTGWRVYAKLVGRPCWRFSTASALSASDFDRARAFVAVSDTECDQSDNEKGKKNRQLAHGFLQQLCLGSRDISAHLSAGVLSTGNLNHLAALVPDGGYAQ